MKELNINEVKAVSGGFDQGDIGHALGSRIGKWVGGAYGGRFGGYAGSLVGGAMGRELFDPNSTYNKSRQWVSRNFPEHYPFLYKPLP